MPIQNQSANIKRIISYSFAVVVFFHSGSVWRPEGYKTPLGK